MLEPILSHFPDYTGPLPEASWATSKSPGAEIVSVLLCVKQSRVCDVAESMKFCARFREQKAHRQPPAVAGSPTMGLIICQAGHVRGMR